MARVCQVTGKHTIAGNHVSKAHNKVKRVFKPNIQKKRFFFPEEDRWITLKISAKGMKIITKRGLAVVVKELRAEGHKI